MPSMPNLLNEDVSSGPGLSSVPSCLAFGAMCVWKSRLPGAYSLDVQCHPHGYSSTIVETWVVVNGSGQRLRSTICWTEKGITSIGKEKTRKESVPLLDQR